MGTSESPNLKKANDLPSQYQFNDFTNLQGQINAISHKIRSSRQILYNNGALTGAACGCFVFGIDYSTGNTYYKDASGNWVLITSGGGGGGIFDAIVNFDVNIDPNTGGTTFTPNNPALDTVLYVSTIDFSQWTYSGGAYHTYFSPFWTTSGNPSVAGGDFIGSINNAALKFRTNNTQVGIFDTTGNFGIATASPSEKLQVTGNVRFSGALMPNNLPGAATQVLTSAGAGVPPIWTTPNVNFWSIIGNNGTTVGTDFVGTTDATGLMFKTNSVQSGYIDLIKSNTSFGQSSLIANTTGSLNAAVGYQALKANTSGTNNTAVGYNSLLANTTGIDNSAFGNQTMITNISGGHNSAFGFGALFFNTASNNSAFGDGSLIVNSTGANNTAIGKDSLHSSTTGANNVAVGYTAGNGNTTGFNNCYFGSQSAIVASTGDNNCGFGFRTLFATTTGTQNTAIGGGTMTSNTTGSNNVCIGFQSGYYNTTASNQIFINSIPRGTYIGDKTASPIYIQQNATVSSQLIGLNGKVGINKIAPAVDLDVFGAISVTDTGTGDTGISTDPALVNIGTTVVGDWLGNGLGNRLTIDDPNELILLGNGSCELSINNVAATMHLANNAGNGTGIFIDDAAQTLTLQAFSQVSVDGTIKLNNYGSGTHTATPAYTLQVDSTGIIIEGNIGAAGTWTPTVANVTNATSNTPVICHYIRTGNQVSFSGSVGVTTTLAAATVLSFTVPVPTTFAATTDAAGVGQSTSAIATNIYMQANSATNKIELRFIGLSIGGAGTIFFSGHYTII